MRLPARSTAAHSFSMANIRAIENHPRHHGVRVGDGHLRGANGTWMGGRNSGRDLCHGRRSLLLLCETQASSGFKQHGHRSRSRPGVSLPPRRKSVAAAVEHSRHCGRGDDLRCGRTDPVAPPFQVESSRRAPLIGDRQRGTCNRCKVISGGQLKRTGTTDDPAPTDVYPIMS